jgi:hypothetical protein
LRRHTGEDPRSFRRRRLPLPNVSSMPLIYGVIVGVWAVVLVPRWRRSRQAPADPRSSHDARVLSRRRSPMPAGRSAALPPPPASRRPRAAGMAVRRRRVALALLILTVVAAGTGGARLIPLPAAILPAVLLVAYLMLPSLTGGSRRRARRRPVDREPAEEPTPVGAWRAPVGVPLPAGPVVEPPSEQPSDTPERADGDGWEPVPVPLPTYVTAPVARRPIRTIDLTTPGAWTDSAQVDARPAGGPADPGSPETAAASRRAVND